MIAPTVGRVGLRGGLEPDPFVVCERITRRRAGNFWYGIRLLPPAKRAGLSTVYAVARRIDDVGDGPIPAEKKLRLLARLRRDLDDARAGAADPVLAALAIARDRFGLPMRSFQDLIDGVEADVRWRPPATIDDTVAYCRRVAGSIGRLSVAVFGSSDPDRAAALGDDLGVAMQLTNILRDVREDAEARRCYLPAADLEAFACSPARPLDDAPPEALSALVRFEAGRARVWFASGLELLPLLDRRSAACVGAMAGIYRRILARIEDEPTAVLASRVSLRPAEKAAAAARSLLRRTA